MMSQSTDLSRLLSEARLECYRENLENELQVSSVAQLRQLRNYSELTQIGMKREEIERLRRLLKGNTMSKLRKLKAINGRSLDLEVPPGSRKEPRSALDAGTFRENGWSTKPETGTVSKSSRSEFNPNAVKDSRPKVTGGRRLVQRSISASIDRDRSISIDPSARSSSLVRNAGREVTAGSNGHAKPRPKNGADELYFVDDILAVLSGPPYSVEPTTSDDTSPLIQSDVEPFVGARHSFDNLASVESTSEVVESLTGVATHPSGDFNNCQDENKEVVTSVRGKRKKPSLKISIPDPDNGVRCSLKPMSALAERQINEAIELASTFARLSTEERLRHAPRTPGSFSDGCSSPGSHFFFSLRKNRGKEVEKKSFLDGASTSEPDRVMTPGALEAYDALVTRTPGVVDEHDESTRRSWESSGGESSSSGERRLAPPPSHLVLNGCSPNRSPGSDEEKTHRTHLKASSSSPTCDHMDDMDGLSIPAYPAPCPPSARVLRHSEHSDPTRDAPPKDDSPPLLPEKKSRRDSVRDSDSPPPYRAPSPPPAIPPPALPPRVRLRPSTVNSRPHQRRFPLASETLPRSYPESAAPHPSLLQAKSLPRQTHESNRSGNPDRRKSKPSHSVESRSSCESDIGNITHESEDSVFGEPPAAPIRAPKLPNSSGRSASLVGSGRPLELNIRSVKLNAAELGIYDKADLFWVKSVNFDLPEKSQSESDLLQDVSAPIPGRYETSDCVSYEDLMEFALDGPRRASRSGTSSSSSLMCKEVRTLMKMFPNDVTIEDCMDALSETFWNIHSAVKLIKLKQVMSTGLADKQQCKQALLFCQWNVNEAALYLLTPPQQRITPDLGDPEWGELPG